MLGTFADSLINIFIVNDYARVFRNRARQLRILPTHVRISRLVTFSFRLVNLFDYVKLR